MSELEAAIATSRSGESTTGELLATFLASTVLVATNEDYDGGKGHFSPLTFSLDGKTSMAVFTSFENMKKFGQLAAFAVNLPGNFVVRGVQPGIGILVNPGADLAFEIAPDIVAKLGAHVESVLSKKQ